MALFEKPQAGAVDKRKVEELRKRVRESPGDVTAVLSLADALMAAGEKREAVLILNRVGSVLQKRDQVVPAIAVYKKVQQIDPKAEITAAFVSHLELKKLIEEHGSPTQADATRISVEKPSVQAASEGKPAIPALEEKKAADRRVKKESVQKLVTGIPFLKDVPPFLIEGVLERIHMKTFEPGEALFREGEAGTSLVFVASGEASVLTKSPEGTDVELGRLHEGDIAGEISFLSGIARTATILAVERTSVLELERQAIDQVIRKNRSFGIALTNLYKERVLDSVLAKSPLFAGLSKSEREFFSSRFEPVEAKPGERIIQEGERDDSLFLIRRGQVRVTRNYAGEEVALAILAPHDIFGDVAAFRHTARTATVTAVTPVELLKLSSQDLGELVNRNPGLHARLEEIQLSRYMVMVEKISSL